MLQLLRDGVDGGGDVVVQGVAAARSAAFRRALRRSWTIAIWTATSKRTTIGNAIAHMVNGSVLGVATAANRKIRKIAIRRDLRRTRAGRAPAKLAITTINGTSNAAPNTTSTSVMNEM